MGTIGLVLQWKTSLVVGLYVYTAFEAEDPDWSSG